MAEDMKKDELSQDPELRSLWGEAWEKAEPGLKSLGSADARSALKHRILNRDFSVRRGRFQVRLGQAAAAGLAAALCALLVIRTQHAAPRPAEVSDSEEVVLEEALDSGSIVDGFSFSLLGPDEFDLTLEDV